MKKFTVVAIVSAVFLFVSFNIASAEIAGDTEQTINACASLNHDLRFGSSDANASGEVTTLQEFLVAQGFLTVEPSGYFGNDTLKAVRALQAANGLDSLGFVGQYTRAVIQEASCGSSNKEETADTPVATTTIAVSNSLVGPWGVGPVDTSRMVFVEFAGLNNSKLLYPKRCLKFQGTTKCAKASDFSTFKWGEWVNASTTRIALKRGKLLEGAYEVYILYSDGQPEKVGAFTTWRTSLSPAVVTVSNSLSGPWEVNGSVDNAGKIYTNITGLKKAKRPKICSVPAGSTKCLTDTELYRTFGSDEWVDATTTQTVIDGGVFPDGTRDIYIRYPIAKSEKVKVGSLTLKAATTTSGNVLGAATRCVDLPFNMHRGNEFPVVKKLQIFLNSIGLMGESTGFYGDQTVAAVKSYQGSRGLPQTGMAYELTRALIKGETCRF